MSFDIFITRYQGGEAHSYPRAVLENAFGGFTDRSNPTRWRMSDSFAVIYLDGADEVHGFCVNRPPYAEHPFWPALVDVLRQTGSALYWGRGIGCFVVADQAVIADLPPDMIKAIGLPTVTTSVSEILRLIREN